MDCSSPASSVLEIFQAIILELEGMVPRWQRNRMGRPLSPPKIHQKIIWMLSDFHKTTSDAAKTPGTQKGSRYLQKEVGQNMKDKKETKELGTETHPGEGVMKEKFPHSRKPSPRQVCGEFWNLRGQHNQERKKQTNKQNPTEYTPSHNCQQRSSPDARVQHQGAGLGREAQAASSVLRVRTWPECPEDNLRELNWDSSPNWGITRETKKRERENFSAKALTRSLAHSQNKGLSEHQWRAGQLHKGPSSARGREASGVTQRQKARGCRNLGPRDGIFHHTVSRFQLLTTWDPGWLTSARRVAAWDQLLRGDTRHTWDSDLMVHPGNRAARTGEVIKMHGSHGRVNSPSTWLPELLGPGKNTKCKLNPVCALAEYPRTWAA